MESVSLRQRNGLESMGEGHRIPMALLGLPRADFLEALFRAKVPACQITFEELKEELESWQRLSGESSTAHGLGTRPVS
jgi:hypothetical protein